MGWRYCTYEGTYQLDRVILQTKHEMRKLVMQTGEPASIRNVTKEIVKFLDSIYAKSDLKQVADNTTQMNAEEITLLLSLLKDFGEFFNGILCDWATEPVDLKVKPYSK